MKNTIVIGSDHRGFDLKEIIKKHLISYNYTILDSGTNSPYLSVDYPDFALKTAKVIQSGKAIFGILICNTGIGMSISANRLSGVRAALCRSNEDALLSRKHNDANILVLGSKDTHEKDALNLLDTFLQIKFESGRHLARIKKIETSL